jgi:hypothetical protein
MQITRLNHEQMSFVGIFFLLFARMAMMAIKLISPLEKLC